MNIDPEMIHVTPGWLRFGGRSYSCAIGAGGLTCDKKEGDGGTPVGGWRLRECWYRADRMPAPVTGLPLRIITERDGWCDDPADAHYNRHVTLPFAASHERLWRDDHVYDIVIPLGYNDDPVIPGKGSAIFFHLARPDLSPTEGCVAIGLKEMTELLPSFSYATRMVIAEGNS